MYDETVKMPPPPPHSNEKKQQKQKRNLEVNLIVYIAVVDFCYIYE